jgi:hypothetical protein
MTGSVPITELPLAGIPMYDALGLGWGNTLLDLVAVAMIPILSRLSLRRAGKDKPTVPGYFVNDFYLMMYGYAKMAQSLLCRVVA